MRSSRHRPVLLHGFAGSSRSWGAQILDGLVDEDLAPIALDLPGHGARAGDTRASSFTLAATLADVADAGDWPTDLVGYSMGARIALHFTAAHPQRVRRLVLESGTPGLATEGERRTRREQDERLAASIVEEGIEAFVDSWEKRPLFETRRRLGREARDHQRALRLGNDPTSLAAALGGLGTGALPSLWDRLAAIEVPTLLLVGELDRKFREIAERMAAAMPDARIVVVPGAGHTVHLERPSEWLAAVTAFLHS